MARACPPFPPGGWASGGEPSVGGGAPSHIRSESGSDGTRLGLPYEVQPIDPAFADTAAYCERYGVALDRAASTLVVAAKTTPRRYAACVVLATTRLDVNRAVRRLLDAPRVSFASADETRTLTGMLLGGVTVFALPEGLPIYVDDKVLARDWVILGSGSRSSKVRVSPEVLTRLPGARVAPLSAQA